MGWCPGWHSLDGHGAQCVAVAFPLAFLGLISNYGKKDKLGGWCNKMPRAQLLVKLWYSVEMAHQTTAVISCNPFLFPQSSSMGKTEMTEKELSRVRKGEKPQLLRFGSAFLSPHSKSSCVDVFYFHGFAKKSFLSMYLLAPSCPGSLAPGSFAHQALVMGFANSLRLNDQGQWKNNVLRCGISCFS